jgi:pimeloyl-ACP methyl ester carboxylesterase
VLIHGLGCNELLWQFAPPSPAAGMPAAVDYGQLLQAESGYTPFYVRYNTGLSVAENGRALGRLLDALTSCYPLPIDEVLLIGHSMGGLVVRSACHYAIQHNEPWVQHVRHVFYLGTPHDGADLARLAHAAEVALHAVPNPITRLIGDVFGVRSQGIKDLSHGTLIEPDVIDEGSDDATHHHRRSVPWLPHAQHYLVAGTVRGDADHIFAVLLGDGLVSAPPTAHDVIPEANIRLFPGIRHLQLARDWEVYQQIKRWRQQADGVAE